MTPEATPAVATRRVLRFEVLGHPTPQKRPIAFVIRNSHPPKASVYDPPENKAWQKVVREAAMRAAKEQGITLPLTGPVELHAAFYGCGKVADLSNLVKLIEDGLNGAVLVDDAQIDRHRTRRYWGAPAIRKPQERSVIELIENPDAV